MGITDNLVKSWDVLTGHPVGQIRGVWTPRHPQDRRLFRQSIKITRDKRSHVSSCFNRLVITEPTTCSILNG